MAKSEQKEVQLQVLLPDVGFPRAMFFNRFRVEREVEFVIVYFGLVSSSGILVDAYCCVFTKESLDNNKKTLLEYYGRSGQPKTPATPWQGVPSLQKSDVADVINMTFSGNHAETSLVLYSRMAAFRLSTEGENRVVPGQAVVLLRSSTETQKQLVKALYEEE